jgi:hypothetical protein
MAITIEQQPTVGVAAYNPVIFSVSSTNDTETDFKYIADLYVDGTKRHTFKFPKNPTYDFGVVDCSAILQSYMSHDFDTTLADNGIEQDPNSIVEFYVEFGEEYTSGGVVSTTTGLTTSNTLDGINAGVNFEDWVDFTFTDYYNTSVEPTKFLTNQPDGRTVPADMNHWLYMANDGTNGSIETVRIKTYDSAGTINGSFAIANDYDGGADDTEDRHLRVPTGINVNNVSSGSVVAAVGALPILDTDVYSYTVETENSGKTNSSEVFDFTREFNTSCNTDYTLHFLNELGGFDSFMMDKVHTKKWKKEQKTYKAEGGTLASDGSYTHTKHKHQRRAYYTETGQTLTLRSDWITEAESVWLRELFDSPVIFMEDPDDNIISITDINIMDYTEKQATVDKIFNLELEVSFSFDNYRQRW